MSRVVLIRVLWLPIPFVSPGSIGNFDSSVSGMRELSSRFDKSSVVLHYDEGDFVAGAEDDEGGGEGEGDDDDHEKDDRLGEKTDCGTTLKSPLKVGRGRSHGSVGENGRRWGLGARGPV